MSGGKIALLAGLLLSCVAAYLFLGPAAPNIMIAPDSVLPVTGEVSGPLSGLNVVIDPGHGGYDQGCQVQGGIYEAPLNLSVSLLLREALEGYGAYVTMTREEDISLVDPSAEGNLKKQDMALRRQVADDVSAQMFLSIHMNYYESSRYSGAQVFYRQDCAQGKALAEAIQAALLEVNPSNTRTASVGDYYVLGIRDAAALVECGFLSNANERARLLTEEYQRQIAEAIAMGVIAYWNEPL